jgi:hypothetical protein
MPIFAAAKMGSGSNVRCNDLLEAGFNIGLVAGLHTLTGAYAIIPDIILLPQQLTEHFGIAIFIPVLHAHAIGNAVTHTGDSNRILFRFGVQRLRYNFPVTQLPYRNPSKHSD